MTGITSYGAYVPRLRLNRMSVFQHMGWFAPAVVMVAQGERSFCNWDEDSLTMAVAAAQDCLKGLDKRTVDALYLCSTTLPFADRLNAGIVKTALNLRNDLVAQDLTSSLKAGTSGLITALSAVRSGDLHRALVVAEVAISLVLLIGAGLLLKSYWQLNRVPLGFTPENVLTTNLRLSGDPYDQDDLRRRFFNQVIEKLDALPGVDAAGGISILPMRGYNDTFFQIEGRPPVTEADRQGAQNRIVSGDYFAAMRIATLEGRTFGAADTPASPGAVVINDAFAREFFPGEKAVGKILVLDFGKPFRAEIIGVVAGARQAIVRPPWPEFYVFNEQWPAYSQNVVLRTGTDPASLASAVRAAVWEVDRDQTLSEFVTLETVASQASALQRFNAIALTTFAALALVLSVVGTYGVLAYSVSRRTHEIGVRMALGAKAQDVLWLVMRQGTVLAGAGIAVGLLTGYWLARSMESLLFEVSAHDPLTFAAAPMLLLAAALLACYVPARRAARVDPMIALRHE